MPPRGSSDRELVVAEFDGCFYPSGSPTLDEAWLGIYQVLWWFEHGLIHVCEANELEKGRAWAKKAEQAASYIATTLGIDDVDLPGYVDRMIQLPRWTKANGEPMQRNNPVGHGLRMLVSEVLERWGDSRFGYPEEVKPANFFPGISLPGRSDRASIDVCAVDASASMPRAIISCKWSIRHDRISDPTNECTEYKAAAIKRQNMHLQYLVVTNEMGGTRLDKVISQPCVDALVHVHLPLAEMMNDGGTTLMQAAKIQGRLFDLTDLARATRSW